MVCTHVCAVRCLILHVSVCMCLPAVLVFYLTSRALPEDVLFILQPKTIL